MIKILNIGTRTKRDKVFYKTSCPYCLTKLVFEFGDIWWDQPRNEIGRIECPVCRTKVHLDAEGVLPTAVIRDATEQEYNDALSDTSKSGLEMLIAEKRKEDFNATDL